MSGLLSRIAVGLGEGAKVYGQISLEKQRDERLAALQEKMQKSSQEFQTSERESTQTYRSDDREDQQDFQGKQTEGSQTFTSGENNKQRDFQGNQTESGQTFTASENSKQRDFTANQNDLDRNLRLDTARSKAVNANQDTVKEIKYADNDSGNFIRTFTSGKQDQYDAEFDVYFELGKGKPKITDIMRDDAMVWGREFAEQQAKTFGKDKTDFPIVQSEERAGILAGQLYLNAMISGPEAKEEFRTQAAKEGFSFIENQAAAKPAIVESVKSGKLSTSKPSTSQTIDQLQVAFDRYPNADKKQLAQAMIDSSNVPESVKQQARAFLKAN